MAARDPVADLRRIAFLLERANEATYRVRAFRGAAAALAQAEPGRDRGQGGRRHADQAQRRRRRDRPLRGRVAARRGAGLPAPARGDRGLRRRRGGGRAAPGAARRLPQPLRLVRRRLADRGDGGRRDRPRPRVPGADRPLAPADRRARAVRRAAARAARRGRRAQRDAGRPGSDFRLLTGIEVDILADGSLDQERRRCWPQLDVVVGSVHSGLRTTRTR